MRIKSIVRVSAMCASIAVGCGSRVQDDSGNHTKGSDGLSGANALAQGESGDAGMGSYAGAPSNSGGGGRPFAGAPSNVGGGLDAGGGSRAGASNMTGGSGSGGSGGRPSAGAPNFGGSGAGVAGVVEDPNLLGACPTNAQNCRSCLVQQCSIGAQECGFSQACGDYLTQYLSCGNDGHKLPGRLILCIAGECNAACQDKVM